MEIHKVHVDKLKHAEYNPRTISDEKFEQIKKSLLAFGFVQPLVVNSAEGREGIIIAGNQRFEAGKSINLKEFPVFYVKISDISKEKELNIRLNHGGEWDNELLKKNFTIGELNDWGFDPIELSFFETDILEEKENQNKCPHCGYKQRKKKNL